mmetsp:Transcript_16208/g.32626  ORF Transcript_16208/g.32626 Transcript_16208/m.32626 type:complete len:470 (+) Transcript_16208:202-1611(+)
MAHIMIMFSSGESEGSDDEASFVYPETMLDKIKRNAPGTTTLSWGFFLRNMNMSDDGWEELGRDVSNNTHLRNVYLNEGALNDRKMSFFCRGLTRSNTIEDVHLYENGLSAVGVRSMVPFLQNANNLHELLLCDNNIKSEGFNAVFRALRDSPIEALNCDNCGIEAIEIDSDYSPKHLTTLRLNQNRINADGCRQISKLLQGGGAILTYLHLRNNKIDDDGVAILVDALQKNVSLQILDLMSNEGIFAEGRKLCLKLVNDVSSITATLHSNHTLTSLDVEDMNPDGSLDADDEIQRHIYEATEINSIYEGVSNPEAAGREKLIQTQLHSEKRAALCRLQGVDHSVFSEIDPLHLPEVLSLIGRHHGQGELYLALKSSIMTLFSTMNMKKCIHQERAYHAAKVEELDAKLAAIVAEHAAIVAEHRTKIEELDAKLTSMDEAVEVNEGSNELEHRSNKRRRKWWWGLWGGA